MGVSFWALFVITSLVTTLEQKWTPKENFQIPNSENAQRELAKICEKFRNEEGDYEKLLRNFQIKYEKENLPTICRKLEIIRIQIEESKTVLERLFFYKTEIFIIVFTTFCFIFLRRFCCQFEQKWSESELGIGEEERKKQKFEEELIRKLEKQRKKEEEIETEIEKKKRERT